MDAVEILEAAAARLDATTISSVLSETVEFATPVSSRLVIRGRADVQAMFTELFSVFDRVDCRVGFRSGDQHVLVLDCRFGRFALTDAMLLTLADDGRVSRFEPHLRPWTSSGIFIMLIGARLLRHPGLLVRSLRRHPAEWPVTGSGS